eukprot:282142-Rhodomonas_salina.2
MTAEKWHDGQRNTAHLQKLIGSDVVLVNSDSADEQQACRDRRAHGGAPVGGHERRHPVHGFPLVGALAISGGIECGCSGTSLPSPQLFAVRKS